MHISLNGLHFIEDVEGNILYAYDDATEKRVPVGGVVRGTLTIGVGHTSSAGLPQVYAGMTITPDQADQILTSDLSKVVPAVNGLLSTVSQNVFDGATSFAFNVGNHSFETCSWVPLYKQGKMVDAEQHLMLWTKGRVNGESVEIPGLVNRRKREADLIFRGNYGLKGVTNPPPIHSEIPVQTQLPQIRPIQSQTNPFIQFLINVLKFLFRRK